jgi:phosphoglycerate-specific signal transduction histidine kinase
MIRTVHHELNNPMAIIDLTLNKINSSPEQADAQLRTYLKEVQDNVSRMSDILRRLMNFRDEMYNEELRGLKLFAIPEKPLA